MLSASITTYCHPGKGRPTLSKCSIELHPGSIAAVVGPSGAGKTSLLTVLVGTAPGRMEGHVSYSVAGRTYTPRAAADAGLFGYASQETTLLPWLRVGENLELPARLNSRLSSSSVSPRKLLRAVGLPDDILGLFPHTLSVGMRQRVAIVRTLMYQPRFVFLDEVFSGLDSGSARLVDHLIREYFHTHDAACVLVTHDVERTYGLAQRRFLLTAAGTLCEMTDLSRKALTSLLEQEQRHLVEQSLNPFLEAT